LVVKFQGPSAAGVRVSSSANFPNPSDFANPLAAVSAGIG
jgi:hypothetical protein